MSETSDTTFWIWVAGAAVAAWNGLLSLILGYQLNTSKDLRQELREVKGEREDHCIPRAECERTHEALNARVDRMEDELKAEIRTGIAGIHKRLDKICGGEK